MALLKNVYNLMLETLAQTNLLDHVSIRLDCQTRIITVFVNEKWTTENYEPRPVKREWDDFDPEDLRDDPRNHDPRNHDLLNLDEPRDDDVDLPVEASDSMTDDADNSENDNNDSRQHVPAVPENDNDVHLPSMSSSPLVCKVESEAESLSALAPLNGRVAPLVEDGPCQPLLIKYPVKRNGRCFQLSWYLKYPWLSYSLEKNVAFCFACQR